MKEARVILKVEVALDGIPGSYDNVGDMVRLIARTIPPWYLRSIFVEGDVFDEYRPSDAVNQQNMKDIAAYAERMSGKRGK